MNDLYWSPVEIEAYKAIIAAHNARSEQRFVVAVPHPPEQRSAH
ncbi:MAG: hypothetical protein JWO78_1212 [Micavibrio sp.]|nr:hypothetical protein [Micavibrio sp.]